MPFRHISVCLWTLTAIIGLGTGLARPAYADGMPKIKDKTLVAWVYLNTLDQRAGSAITLDDRKTHFDGIVFGEIAARKWMAGSDGFSRSAQDQ
ncbi:MAG: hypothetical protein K1Y02_24735, partial [Candidatus Hydrogenedentes bacterium]|nr:hypothetical protein [Candidatus Hydrogenedentota bacterium]